MRHLCLLVPLLALGCEDVFDTQDTAAPWDLVVAGEGFDDAVPDVVVVLQDPEHRTVLGTETDVVAEGRWSVYFPDVVERDVLYRVHVWLDADGDDACGDDEVRRVGFMASANTRLDLAPGEGVPGDCGLFP